MSGAELASVLQAAGAVGVAHEADVAGASRDGALEVTRDVAQLRDGSTYYLVPPPSAKVRI
jgi:hypothetical protein